MLVAYERAIRMRAARVFICQEHHLSIWTTWRRGTVSSTPPTRRTTGATTTSSWRRSPSRSTDRVLDVGCGSGDFTAKVAALVPDGHVVGLEPQPSMVDEARRAIAAQPVVRAGAGTGAGGGAGGRDRAVRRRHEPVGPALGSGARPPRHPRAVQARAAARRHVADRVRRRRQRPRDRRVPRRRGRLDRRTAGSARAVDVPPCGRVPRPAPRRRLRRRRRVRAHGRAAPSVRSRQPCSAGCTVKRSRPTRPGSIRTSALASAPPSTTASTSCAVRTEPTTSRLCASTSARTRERDSPEDESEDADDEGDDAERVVGLLLHHVRSRPGCSRRTTTTVESVPPARSPDAAVSWISGAGCSGSG